MVIVLLRLYGYGQFCLKARSFSALSCRVPFRFWFPPTVARDVFHAFHLFCPRLRPLPEVPGRGGGAVGSLAGAPGPRSAVCSRVAASIIITSARGSPRRVLPAPARPSQRASKQNMLDCSETALGVWGQKGCSQARLWSAFLKLPLGDNASPPARPREKWKKKRAGGHEGVGRWAPAPAAPGSLPPVQRSGLYQGASEWSPCSSEYSRAFANSTVGLAKFPANTGKGRPRLRSEGSFNWLNSGSCNLPGTLQCNHPECRIIIKHWGSLEKPSQNQ